jgi:hypothetical protein
LKNGTVETIAVEKSELLGFRNVWQEEKIFGEDTPYFTLWHLDTYEDYYPNMEQKTLKIRVHINSIFTGSDEFYLTEGQIKAFIDTLTAMHRDLKGKCEIKNTDLDSDSYIILEMGDFGHLSIVGQLGATWKDDLMKFKLSADQTILPRLTQVLSNFLTE